MEELANNGVNIYRFPVDDETVAEMNSGMNVSSLFLICLVGAYVFIIYVNKIILTYPAGNRHQWLGYYFFVFPL